MNRSPLVCGGSAAAAIYCAHVGAPAFGDPWSVWAAAHRPELLRPPGEDLRRLFAMGLALEGFLREELRRSMAAESGQVFEVSGEVDLRTGDSWMGGHCDGLVWQVDSDDESRPVGIVELKTGLHGVDDWWLDGAPVVPAQYEVQGRWYLMMARRVYGPAIDRIEYIVMDSRCKLHRRTVQHDADREREVLAVVRAWWQKHIQGGEMPPVDSSDMCGRALLAARAKSKETVQGSDRVSALAQGLAEARKRKAKAEEDEAMAKNMLLAELPGDRVEFETGPVRLVTLSSNNVIKVRSR